MVGELQSAALAVRHRPVYKPARRYLRPDYAKASTGPSSLGPPKP